MDAELIPFKPGITPPGPASPEKEDDRDPIDEPFLPEDPGDEPETELRAVLRRHRGELVHVQYVDARGLRHISGILRFGALHAVIETPGRLFRVRCEKIIRVRAEGEVWSCRCRS